jgi:hypothetical protein
LGWQLFGGYARLYFSDGDFELTYRLLKFVVDLRQAISPTKKEVT